MEAAELRALVQRKLQVGFVGGDELYVVWRKQDVISVAGKNIHPQDIEEIVSSHPADSLFLTRCSDE